jgi:hypothetical protein
MWRVFAPAHAEPAKQAESIWMIEMISRPMFQSLIGGILIMASLAACATMPRPNPRAEAKLQEADTALDSLSAEITVFYEKLEMLLEDIRKLYGYPGWGDMEIIIESTASNDQDGGQSSIAEDLKVALEDWTTKWEDSGERLFSRYLSLVDRCSASEARRIGLIGRLASIQATYLEITLMELSINRYAQATGIYSTVEALSKSEDELNSYILNAIGLYDVKPSR